MKRKSLGQAFLFHSSYHYKENNLALVHQKRQSTPNVGCTDCTQDAEVKFPSTGSSSTLYLCSGKAESRKMSDLPPAPTSLLIAFLIIQH